MFTGIFIQYYSLSTSFFPFQNGSSSDKLKMIILFFKNKKGEYLKKTLTETQFIEVHDARVRGFRKC